VPDADYVSGPFPLTDGECTVSQNAVDSDEVDGVVDNTCTWDYAFGPQAIGGGGWLPYTEVSSGLDNRGSIITRGYDNKRGPFFGFLGSSNAPYASSIGAIRTLFGVFLPGNRNYEPQVYVSAGTGQGSPLLVVADGDTWTNDPNGEVELAVVDGTPGMDLLDRCYYVAYAWQQTAGGAGGRSSMSRVRDSDGIYLANTASTDGLEVTVHEEVPQGAHLIIYSASTADDGGGGCPEYAGAMTVSKVLRDRDGLAATYSA
jgi:hypothetical protein